MKKSATPSKELENNPIALSKALGKTYSHVILHKQGTGFSFTVFWIRDDNDQPEPVATGFKPFKTKGDCIKAIKKLGDASPGLGRAFSCFDYNLQKVDAEIKYDIKKLL